LEYLDKMEKINNKIKEQISRSTQYFDRNGNRLQLMDWAKKCEDDEYRKVKQDKIGKYFISTIWFGLNMNFFSNQEPLIFETMIFLDDDDQLDEFYLYQEEYSTEQQALEGHERAVKLVRDGNGKTNL